MAAARVSRATVAVGLDVAIFVAGLLAAVPFVLLGVGRAGDMDPGRLWIDVAAIALVYVMARYPLTIPHESGDIVIGFETCVLVFLLLTGGPVEAFAVWSIATAIANGTQRKAWRSRIFNVGITILCGALLVLVYTVAVGDADHLSARSLAAVMAACAVFFSVDLFVTAGTLAIEDGCRIRDMVNWSSVALGLACFVSVDTLGFLAAVLSRSDQPWTMLLLLVPVGTILVAVNSISETRLAQLRLTGLLEAATHAPDWSDDDQIERSLVLQAQRTLRHTTAELRDEPPAPHEIGAAIEVEGRPVRHLVVQHQVSGRVFDERDRAALEALTAVGVSAYNRRRLSDEMTYLARHDALTGLNNRAVFTDRLGQALENRRRGLVAVLYADLDGFKEVNDLLGHRVGDQLLSLAAQRIMGCIREQDTAARLGGDEFGILLDDLTDESQAHVIAARVLECLGDPFDTIDGQVRVRVSVGVAFNDDPRDTAEILINSADTAMYVAKARGKGRVEQFHPAMRAAELDRLELEAALRDAVRDDRITVHYQPVVDLVTGAVDGFEALARWHDPQLGQVPPDIFIAAAERIGLIRQLGRQILAKAHAGGRELAAAAGRPVSLGVNLSALQVSDDTLAEEVRLLAESFAEVQLILELTEGVMLSNDPVTVAAIEGLKSAGVRLAIDDFGVGYSSVGYLHRLPVDILKIDKLFVSELHDPRSHALVEGVVSMARAMELTVVTEGVEDWSSARSLRDLHCDLAQGFLFSRPVPLEQAKALIVAGHIDVSPMSAEVGAGAF
ncbi:MAG TPA: EAL domain-containing protein [Candidatus Nanopelagicales bacterium]|nr:EAL domain-containing protein [Candidatus Nanopelagicales bacterium]